MDLSWIAFNFFTASDKLSPNAGALGVVQISETSVGGQIQLVMLQLEHVYLMIQFHLMQMEISIQYMDGSTGLKTGKTEVAMCATPISPHAAVHLHILIQVHN